MHKNILLDLGTTILIVCIILVGCIFFEAALCPGVDELFGISIEEYHTCIENSNPRI